MKVVSLSALVLVGFAITGCDRRKTDDYPAVRNAWVATQPGAEPSATAVVRNGTRAVTASQGPDGSRLNLKRGEQSGAVRVVGGATQIQGQAGTLNVPNNGALPSAL